MSEIEGRCVERDEAVGGDMASRSGGIIGVEYADPNRGRWRESMKEDMHVHVRCR